MLYVNGDFKRYDGCDLKRGIQNDGRTAECREARKVNPYLSPAKAFLVCDLRQVTSPVT